MGAKPPSQTRLSFLDGASVSTTPAVPEGPRVYTVTQIVRGANRLLDARFTNIWIEGEVVGLKVGRSGHAYFTLKDDGAQVPAAMWSTSVESLRFELADGQVLRAFGRLGIFAKQGRFQFYVERAEPAGLGALMLELEQRKARLAAEGLFDTDRKRPLPGWPRRVGVVTSAQGAALHDILEVARRRCPMAILVSPAPVQGPEAPRELVRALRRLYRWPGVEVIIIARGGGAMEDLWAFNDEALVRELVASPVPVVSGVGHEIDVTLCDLAADLRAATPSQAAELVVPDREAARQRHLGLERRLHRAVERAALEHRGRLEMLTAMLARLGRALVGEPRRQLSRLQQGLRQHHPRARVGRDRRRLQQLTDRLGAVGGRLDRAHRQRLATLTSRLLRRGQALPVLGRARQAELAARLEAAGEGLVRPSRLRLARATAALDALSPLSVLTRGYAVVTGNDGRAVTDAAEVDPGDPLTIALRRGTLHATVTTIAHEEEEPRD